MRQVVQGFGDPDHLMRATRIRLELAPAVYLPLDFNEGLRPAFKVEEAFVWKGHVFILRSAFYVEYIADEEQGRRTYIPHFTCDVLARGAVFEYDDLQGGGSHSHLMYPREEGWRFKERVDGVFRRGQHTEPALCGLLYFKAGEEEAAALGV
jgi:hypothetical protein